MNFRKPLHRLAPWRLLAVLVCVTSVTSGCQKMIPLATPIVVRLSWRDLAIRNELQTPITVLPLIDRPNDPPIVVAPGTQTIVPLHLEETARLEPIDPNALGSGRRYMLGAGDAGIATLPRGKTPYVGGAGEDAVVRIV